jgi:hypothetical protein
MPRPNRREGRNHPGRSIADLELRDEHADDGVTAPTMIPDLHLIPGLWKIDGYSKLSGYLQRQFAVNPGKNFFTFPMTGAGSSRTPSSSWSVTRWEGWWPGTS